jgi:hypothetical protein
MEAEARRLGITIDTNTARKAAEFNDTLTKINRMWEGFITQVAARLLPVLQQIADAFTKLTTDGNAMKLALDGIEITIKSIITTGIAVNAVFQALAASIASVVAALILLGQGEFRAVLDTLKQGGADFRAEFERAGQALRDLWTATGQATNQWAAVVTATQNAAAPIVASNNAIRDAQREWMDEQRADLDVFLASTETRLAKLAELQVAYQNGVINQRTYGQMVRSVEKENQNAITGTASLMASTLTTVFAKSKAAAIAAAIISTAVGITNALAGPPTGPPWPFNMAQAALIAASGAAQIAKISSTSSSGGGSAPTVSAGGGGGGVAEPTGPTQMVNLSIHGDNFSRAQVLNLMEQMNEAMADGAQLVVNRK